MTRLLSLCFVACAGCHAPRLPDPDDLLFARLDTDGSGSLAGDELGSPSPPDLRDLDRDGSGDVSPEELAALLARPPHSVLRMTAAQRGKARRHAPKAEPPTDDGRPPGPRGPPHGAAPPHAPSPPPSAPVARPYPQADSPP